VSLAPRFSAVLAIKSGEKSGLAEMGEAFEMGMFYYFLLVHLTATWALVGLIWVVQCVQYPLYEQVGGEEFRAFHAQHCRRITWVVGPLMLAELTSGLGLLWLAPSQPALWLGFGLLLLIWASTAFLQVPLHDHLAKGQDIVAIRRLVRSNWLRTLAWTARGGVVIWLWMAFSKGLS
jgi:hypothetical protein